MAYIDDFEGTETSIELKNRDAWVLASSPYPESARIGLSYNFNRAKLAWYVIDPLFTTRESKTPSHIDVDETSKNNYVRQVYEREIYKEKESGTGIEPPHFSIKFSLLS
ncbi:MAG: hypothetical protein HC906_02160 [Bacteroidales bacterium]|nr:hypothetical protein [Bacteroidales bacterium]